jgi:hypothetical protein
LHLSLPIISMLIVVERLWRSNSVILINRNTLSHYACTTMALLLTYCCVIIQTIIALSKIGKENVLLGNGNDRQRQMHIITYYPLMKHSLELHKFPHCICEFNVDVNITFFLCSRLDWWQYFIGPKKCLYLGILG